MEYKYFDPYQPLVVGQKVMIRKDLADPDLHVPFGKNEIMWANAGRVVTIESVGSTVCGVRIRYRDITFKEGHLGGNWNTAMLEPISVENEIKTEVIDV